MSSRYETMSVDRRASYYARAVPCIVADPLDYYCRIERGRRWLATNLGFAGYEYERQQLLDASPVEPEYEH